MVPSSLLRQTRCPPAFVILPQRPATLQIGHIKRIFPSTRKKFDTEHTENTETGHDHNSVTSEYSVAQSTTQHLRRWIVNEGPPARMVVSLMLQHRRVMIAPRNDINRSREHARKTTSIPRVIVIRVMISEHRRTIKFFTDGTVRITQSARETNHFKKLDSPTRRASVGYPPYSSRSRKAFTVRLTSSATPVW